MPSNEIYNIVSDFSESKFGKFFVVLQNFLNIGVANESHTNIFHLIHQIIKNLQIFVSAKLPAIQYTVFRDPQALCSTLGHYHTGPLGF